MPAAPILSHEAERLDNSQRIAGVGDWEDDFVNHRLLWSEEVYRILGLVRTETPPDSAAFYRLVHPDDLAFVQREKKTAAEGSRRVEFEHRIIRPDGKVRHIHQIAEMVFDDQGRRIRESGTIQDITERKLAEEELRGKTALLEAQIDSSIDGILIVDPRRRIILQNQRFIELMKLPRKIAAEKDEARTLQFMSGLVRSPELFNDRVEHLYAHPDESGRDEIELEDGTVFDRYSSPVQGKEGGNYGRIWVYRDITARKASEVALRESEERFKHAARAVSDVVWDRNLTANTLWWNDGFQTIFGFAANEIEPGVESWTNRLHPDEQSRVVASIHQAIDTGAESWSAEYRFQRKDGSHAFVQDRGFILRDAAGKGVRMVGGMRDLTEQKKTEIQSLRAQRMESIGTLASGIAHDLNNVLAPIMLSIELLKLDPLNDPKRGKTLDNILASGRRGTALVRQILTFAQGLDGPRVAIQLRHQIKEFHKIIGETFSHDIRIVEDVAPDLWPITGDPTQLHQVLLNLAVNARDAMPQGGTLTLAATNVTLDARSAGMSPEAGTGPHVLLQVTDTGLGIPPEVRGRIFELFFTTKERGKGTGIGLATVHTIVKNHGGFLNFESEPGRGTTFKVYLPANPDHQIASSVHPFQAALPRGQDELVLVVDDEYSIRDITRQTLEAFGYRVITACDGAEAVALYAKQAPEIAVVLTDMMMPVMDGAAAIQLFKRINPALKIIAASGIDSGENISKASSVGVKHFLLKPYTAGTLLKLLREVLDHPTPPVAC